MTRARGAARARRDDFCRRFGQPTDWKASIAFRWRKQQRPRGDLQPVSHVHRISLTDLQGIDEQKALIEQNTRQFVDGRPANNVLLTGARGTGKSSLIKALLNEYSRRGPAPDRGRQAGSHRSAGHRRPIAPRPRTLHPVLRRSLVRSRRARLQGAEGRARRLHRRGRRTTA